MLPLRKDAAQEQRNWLPIAAIALGTALVCLGVVGILVVMRLQRGGPPAVTQVDGAADPSQHTLPISRMPADPLVPPGLPSAVEADGQQRLPDSSVAPVTRVAPKPSPPPPASAAVMPPAVPSVARSEPPAAESTKPAPAVPPVPAAEQTKTDEPATNPASPPPAVGNDAPDNNAPAPRQPIPSGEELRRIETQIDELYHPRAAAALRRR